MPTASRKNEKEREPLHHDLRAGYSLVATCEANDVNPYEYLRDLTMRVSTHVQAYGGPGDQHARAVSGDHAGNFAVTGDFTGTLASVAVPGATSSVTRPRLAPPRGTSSTDVVALAGQVEGKLDLGPHRIAHGGGDTDAWAATIACLPK